MRAMAISNVTDFVAQQSRELCSRVQQLENQKATLQGELSALTGRCDQKKAELSRLEGQLEGFMQGLPPASADDGDVVCLDVGGRAFKTHRSTLTQIDGSMLASLASTRGANGAQQSDGQIFLDMAPESFAEILAFLRERRFDPSATPIFTSRSAWRLATYLLGEQCLHLCTRWESLTEIASNQFMFDLFMPGELGCLLKAICFSTYDNRGGDLTVYMLKGSFLGAPQTDALQWCKVCEAELASSMYGPGIQRVELPSNEMTYIAGNSTVSICLFSTGSKICYSAVPHSKHIGMTKSIHTGEQLHLRSTMCRCAGVDPFTPGPHDEQRFFTGAIEYVVS